MYIKGEHNIRCYCYRLYIEEIIGKKLTLMIGEKVLQRINVPFMNKVKESRSECYLEIWREK